MKSLLYTLLGSALLSATSASPASAAPASDWYVDGQNGNNSNSGTSPQTAWKTITYAVASTLPGTTLETIHVAPGTYDPALGEAFPIAFRPRQQLLGAGAATTVIDGAGVGVELFRMESNHFGGFVGWDTTSQLRDLTLRNAKQGLYISSNWSTVEPTVEDVVIESMSGAGIKFLGTSAQGAAGSAAGTFRRVQCRNNQRGAEIIAWGSVSPFTAAYTNPLFEDCVFAQNLLDGAVLTGSAPGGDARATFTRCVLNSNAQSGLRCSYSQSTFGGYARPTLVNCSISGNGGDGYDGQPGSAPSGNGGVIGTLRRCSIANNPGIGIRAATTYFQQTHTTVLEACIVHGNGDDVFQNGTTTAKYCDIGDGDFAGANGNFSADPRFVNAPAGDFHLNVDSPCIDTGDPAAPLDPDCSRSDVGAYPRGSPQIYCTAKLNSCGALPAIGWSGTPSASANSGFVVSASGTKASKPGLLLYGDQGPAAVPFSGGTLCIAPAVRRSPALFETTGTPGACDGVLQLDVNAFAHGLTGGNPAPSLLIAGTRFHAQFWGRDTASQALLSDALEFVVCP